MYALACIDTADGHMRAHMVAVITSAALGVLLMMWAPKQAQGEAVLSTLPQRLPMETVGLVDQASLLIDVLQVRTNRGKTWFDSHISCDYEGTLS
jgi:hypothetical protein